MVGRDDSNTDFQTKASHVNKKGAFQRCFVVYSFFVNFTTSRMSPDGATLRYSLRSNKAQATGVWYKELELIPFTFRINIFLHFNINFTNNLWHKLRELVNENKND